MSGLHAYHPFPVAAGASEITLSPAESAHLTRSLRARRGESASVFDGTGRRWSGVVLSPDAKALTIGIESAETLAPPAPALVLAQALPKGGLMDDIIRQSVEIGAAAIFPLLSARCETRLDPVRAASRLARWRTIAIEACKQSGNPFLPEIAPPAPLGEWLASPAAAEPDTLALTGSLEPDARPLPAAAADCRAFKRLVFLIGPEGDFTPEEYALARSRGFLPVRLAPNVLRVPTAALYALAALDQARQRR